MGWKLRYLGAVEGVDMATLQVAADKNVEFEVGKVYDIDPRGARRVMTEAPNSFERVYSVDDDFRNAVTNIPSLGTPPHPPVSIKLKALRSVPVLGEDGEYETVDAGTVLDLDLNRATFYLQKMPEAFEILDEDAAE